MDQADLYYRRGVELLLAGAAETVAARRAHEGMAEAYARQIAHERSVFFGSSSERPANEQ